MTDEIARRAQQIEIWSSDSDSDSDSGSRYAQVSLSRSAINHAPNALTNAEIVTKYADKIKTDPIKKGPKITRDRSNRAKMCIRDSV